MEADQKTEGEIPPALTETEPAPLPASAKTSSLIPAPGVFWPALVLLVVFVGIALATPDRLDTWLGSINDTIVGDLGWFYVLSVTGFVLFAIVLAVLPVGDIVLGAPEEDPEYSLPTWFSMLFAAGMGIGLVFWGAAEPLNHYVNPPPGTDTGSDASRAQEAMNSTFLHWGLHAWGIYVIVGLAIAYAIHRKGRPVSIRWALEPIFGKRVDGWVGDVIDVFAIIGTIFGVATSLGFGVSQVGAGLGYLGVAETDPETGTVGTGLLVALVIGITIIATLSVVSGIDKGIKFLSNLNMGVAGLFMLAVLILGPTVFLLSEFVQSIGGYLQNFFSMSFRTFANEGSDGQAWLSGWTTFYWGWWIAWSPFVGIFIARISRGRTVREFIIGVLAVPSLVGFLWFSVFGGSALHRTIFGEGGLIAEDGTVSTDLALFQLIDGLPASTLLSVVAIFLVVIFFVTSSDSGSFVVDMIASGGDANPPVWSRVLWASVEGIIAASLIWVGGAGGSGLSALQTMSIIVALPFCVIIIMMAVGLAKDLRAEHELIVHGRRRRFRKSIVDEVREEVGAGPRRR